KPTGSNIAKPTTAVVILIARTLRATFYLRQSEQVAEFLVSYTAPQLNELVSCAGTNKRWWHPFGFCAHLRLFALPSLRVSVVASGSLWFPSDTGSCGTKPAVP